MAYESLPVLTAYADAMGLPYETKTKEEIRSLGGVSAILIRPDTYSDGFPDFEGRAAGTWSDDTQHTLAMIESLCGVHDFDVVDLASHLLQEYQNTSAGWGKTTKQAMEVIRVATSKSELLKSGIKSAGSGPLMRLAPLAIYAAHNPVVDLKNAVYEQTVITHHSAEALVGAYTLASVIQDVVAGQKDVVTSATTHATTYEKELSAAPKLSERLLWSNRSSDLARDIYQDDPFAIWSVLAMAISVVDKCRSEQFERVIASVVSEGGDTDSTAAVAAGIFSALHPDFELDSAHIEILDRHEELQCAGQRFGKLIDTAAI